MSTDTEQSHSLTVGGPRLATAVARLADHEGRLWGVVLATCLADIALTTYGLRLGLAEGNPLAATLVGRLGAVPALALLKTGAVGVAVVGWTVVPDDYRALIPAGIALPWVAASAANLVTIGLELA
jgi:hypothetical protein